MAEGFDGITEFWCDDVDTLLNARDTEAGRAGGKALIDDEARFIDLARSTMFITREHVIFDRSSGAGTNAEGGAEAEPT